MTGADFGRILTLLRKEKGMSQKAAAAELGISQALLSHYERGIRECGLDFVIRVAELYDVSCDYLLGRSPERSGSVITPDELPDGDFGKDNRIKGSLLPTLNKKLLSNSLNVVYGLLSRANSTQLTNDVSAYLDLALYTAYRYIYSANPANPKSAFLIDDASFSKKVDAVMDMKALKMELASRGLALDGAEPTDELKKLTVSPEQLYRDYPLFASSLLNLIRNSEETIKDTLGE